MNDLLFSFDGRLGRWDYFKGILLVFGLGMAIVAVGMAISVVLPKMGITFIAVTMLGLLVPGWALPIKRLHDLDMSGWWVILNVIPVVGFILTLWLLFAPGSAGPNRFNRLESTVPDYSLIDA